MGGRRVRVLGGLLLEGVVGMVGILVPVSYIGVIYNKDIFFKKKWRKREGTYATRVINNDLCFLCLLALAVAGGGGVLPFV